MTALQKRTTAACVVLFLTGLVVSFTAWDRLPSTWDPGLRLVAILFIVLPTGVAFALPWEDDK